MDEFELRLAWQQHVAIDMHEFDAVMARHREPHRRYHGESHVRWVVRHAQQLAGHIAVEQRSQRAEQPLDVGAVIAAAFYHDAIYDPRADDNEAASARLAAEVLARCGWPPERVTAVTSMIEATAGHTDVRDLSTAVLLAGDLAVLASDPAVYAAYVNGVRFEYAHVSEQHWVTGRSAVLQSFIDRRHIFPPELELHEWEARARANIAAELAALHASS